MSEESLETRLNSLSINDKLAPMCAVYESDKWNFPLKDLFRLALNFYKDKEGKALHLSYEDKLKLVAFTQQAKHGPLDSTDIVPLGVLDVIGRDRRLAWMQLGALSKPQAMEGFIDLLDRLCPSFKPYTEAIQKDKEEKERLAKIAEAQKLELEEEEARKEIEKRAHDQEIQMELQKRNIQEALNKQTFLQFRAYAEQQYPANPEQQAVLVRQLQDQHYHQYMQQMHLNQLAQSLHADGDQPEPAQNTKNIINENIKSQYERNTTDQDKGNKLLSENTASGAMDELQESDSESQSDFPSISPASIWTRADLKAFKQAVSEGEGDGVIRVGHGETVTVRVPTHDGGSCLFWEFATDSYDIGFGVYFEWSKSPTNEVTVHISESDEDEEIEDDEELSDIIKEDLESGDLQALTSRTPCLSKPPISVVVPVYRRDCQTEVYAGSHTYPGVGVYLLKFDNSYSLWRSKTLYYRVYYTR